MVERTESETYLMAEGRKLRLAAGLALGLLAPVTLAGCVAAPPPRSHGHPDYYDYYYYPRLEIYYVVHTGYWYYRDRGHWRRDRHPPHGFRPDQHRHVVVRDRDPWTHHDEYRRRYPPNADRWPGDRRDRDYDRDRGDYDRDRDRDRDYDRDRDRGDYDRNRDRDRDGDYGRDGDRESDWNRDRDRDGDRDSDRNRDRDREADRDRDARPEDQRRRDGDRQSPEWRRDEGTRSQPDRDRSPPAQAGREDDRRRPPEARDGRDDDGDGGGYWEDLQRRRR
jgi:hypothetical protein